ncbi:chymotrypsinogen A-like [Protopterus annectens]|uniref:chymotrypsinogen A-like n=1 Tax=Protopterus annectens TaxID=7888 RepID=UPI001CFA4D82|nr:chymotrypsinogen A-like [Protopterus annectens]
MMLLFTRKIEYRSMYFSLFCTFISGASANCGSRKAAFNTRIVGGQDAMLGEFPWQVSLQKGTSHFCGATIISEHWLVSAAHCFPSPAYEIVNAVAGTVERTKPGQTVTTAKVIKHSNYNTKTFDNDIALVLLKEPLAFTDDIKPICFPDDQDMDVETMAVCWVSGWGLTSSDSKSSPVKQQKLDMREDPDCDWELTPNMLCMANDDPARTGCKGDSGGPLACQDRKTKVWILAGAVSFGSHQCTGATVFTRISNYINWVKHKTAESGRPFIPVVSKETQVNNVAPVYVPKVETIPQAVPVPRPYTFVPPNSGQLRSLSNAGNLTSGSLIFVSWLLVSYYISMVSYYFSMS